MTYRQWVIIQQALGQFKEACNDSRLFNDLYIRWDDEDGPLPTDDEIDALSVIVGDMRHDNKPKSKK